MQKIGRYKRGTQAQQTKLYSDLLHALKEGTFDSPGLPPWGTLMDASAVAMLGARRELKSKQVVERAITSSLPEAALPPPE